MSTLGLDETLLRNGSLPVGREGIQPGELIGLVGSLEVSISYVLLSSELFRLWGQATSNLFLLAIAYVCLCHLCQVGEGLA